MNKNIKFTPKNKSKDNKITIFICLILAVLSIITSYFITAAFDKEKTLPDTMLEENINIVGNKNVSVIKENETTTNVIEDEKEILNLIKTYIHSSVNNEEEILYALSTQEWTMVIKEKLKNSKTDENIIFIPTSLTLEKNSLSSTEGYYKVSYVLEHNNETIQQNIEVIVRKTENVWKISKII